MYARDPARSSGLSQSSLLENAGNCGFAHRGCLSPAFSSRLSQSDPIFLGERERDIYMILWNGVGSSTQILLNHNYVLVHQQLNTCRFFWGAALPHQQGLAEGIVKGSRGSRARTTLGDSYWAMSKVRKLHF